MINVVTHSELSTKSTADALARVQPDLIVIDEADAVMGESARSERLFYYKRQHPQTRVVGMSGTAIDGELIKASKLGSITLGEGSPYPREIETVREWSEVLELNSTKHAGALAKLAAPGESIRAAVRRRVIETPGVVVAEGVENIGVSLTVRRRAVVVPPEVKAALAKLRTYWETPGGDELTEAVDFHRHALELSQGFCYRWAWPDGRVDQAWLDARRAWNRAVRRQLKNHAVPGMDSPGLLAEAAAAGKWACPAWADWAAVKSRPPPPTVADWLSRFLVDDAVAWGREEPGIIWYDHSSSLIGPATAAAGDFALYDGNGTDPGVEPGTRTVVASRRAFGRGIELQRFNRMLFLVPPSNAKDAEQNLGRCHRPGQTKPVVADMYLHTREIKAAFESMRDEAQKLYESAPGAEQQKILFADVIV